MRGIKIAIAIMLVGLTSYGQVVIKPLAGTTAWSNTHYLTTDETSGARAEGSDHDSLDFSGDWCMVVHVRGEVDGGTTIISKNDYSGTSPAGQHKWALNLENGGEVRINNGVSNLRSVGVNVEDGNWHVLVAGAKSDTGIFIVDSVYSSYTRKVADWYSTISFANDVNIVINNMYWFNLWGLNGALDIDNIYFLNIFPTYEQIEDIVDLGQYGATYDNDPAYSPSPYTIFQESEVQVWYPLGEGSDAIGTGIYDQKTSGSAANITTFTSTTGWSFTAH